MSHFFCFQEAARFLFHLQPLLAAHTPIKATLDSEALGASALGVQASQAGYSGSANRAGFEGAGGRPRSCRPWPLSCLGSGFHT